MNETVLSVPYRSEPVAVCTIEKANVAINRLVLEDRLGAHFVVLYGVRCSLIKFHNSSRDVHLLYPSGIRWHGMFTSLLL